MRPATWAPFIVGLVVLSCMVVITLLTFIGLSLLSNNSEPEEAARICVFSETEVWCIYPEDDND